MPSHTSLLMARDRVQRRLTLYGAGVVAAAAARASTVVLVGLDLASVTLTDGTQQRGIKSDLYGDAHHNMKADGRSVGAVCTPHQWLGVSWAATHGDPRYNATSCTTCEAVIPVHRIEVGNWTAEASAAVNATEQQPPGQHALLDWGISARSIQTHPDDNLLTPVESALCHNTNFSGLWWEAGAKLVAEQYTAFFSEFKAQGGHIDELVLDPELWMYTWVISMNSPWNTMPDCVTARYQSIQRDERFAPVQAELLQRGFVPIGGLKSPHWLNDSLVLEVSNETMMLNINIFNALVLEITCDYFNSATFTPLRSLYPQARLTNYQTFLWDQENCLPSMNGISYCQSGRGAVTGSLATRDFYGYFINPGTPGDNRWHAGGPGLESTLRKQFGVPKYPQTSFNAFRFDALRGRQMAEVSDKAPFKPWVGYKHMGDPNAQKPPYELTVGTDYYQETLFHLALEGAQDFLFFNPIEFQLSSADNEIFAATLRELDVQFGCEERQWVCDRMSPNTTFTDGYFLSGAVLAGNARVWRLTVGPSDTVAPHAQVHDPLACIQSANSSALEAKLSNADGSTTTILFPHGEVMNSAPSVSRAGVWLQQPASAPMPVRKRNGVAQAFC